MLATSTPGWADVVIVSIYLILLIGGIVKSNEAHRR